MVLRGKWTTGGVWRLGLKNSLASTMLVITDSVRDRSLMDTTLAAAPYFQKHRPEDHRCLED